MLHVHRAERADHLVDLLGQVFAVPPDDPLTPEVVAVPSRGIERWIAQELAMVLGGGALGNDGICTNVDFPFPGRLLRGAVATATGIPPSEDPWLPERLAWALLDVVAERSDDPMLGPLRMPSADRPAASNDRGTSRTDGRGAAPTLARRLGAVRHVADLFDRYAVHRPAMVRRWADGDTSGPDGRDLPGSHRWQPRLWQAVRARLDVPSLAERLPEAVTTLSEQPDLLALPGRLAMFGLTSLPASYVDVVAAIGAHRDVHLLLLHPSDELWRRVAALELDAAGSGRLTALPSRAHDPTAEISRNPLLQAWGRDTRELQLVASLPAHLETSFVGRAGSDEPTSPTLLQRIQADVRADRHPGMAGAPDTPALAPDDDSVQLHDCHGRLRQVEVLRDAILHLLAETPGLEPRDVIVMCPDIETFAPLITAVFGAAGATVEHGDAAPGAPDRASEDAPEDADLPPALRVRLADRSLRRTNPVADVLADVLALVGGRVTATQVLDLAARAPVARAFGFVDDDLETLETWVDDLEVAWGFDGAHRGRAGLPEFDTQTWEAGLRRLLLGLAMADDDLRLVDDVAPYDGVEGMASDLVGRFVELLRRLHHHVDDLAEPRPVDEWASALGRVVDELADVAPEDAWQATQVHALLDGVVDEATLGDRASPVALTVAEVRALLADRLGGRPSWASHRTGDLTFSTLVPMRSVPHRVVCLLGLDDGAFPRNTVTDSDDLLALAPRVGDRDLRSEDRQLLLDAVMAATETLVVTWSGRDVRTNKDRPPAVPVDELRDVIDRTVTVPDERPRDAVTVRHPLAEHDPRNFLPGQLRSEGPWGFDPALQAAADARRRPAVPAPAFLADPLPPLDADVVELDDLVAFLQHPAREFVRRRLDLSLPGADQAVEDDRIRTTLKALEAWRVGDALVRAWFDGHDRDRALAVATASGLVPPGDLARDDLAKITEGVERIVDLAGHVSLAPGRRRSIDVRAELGDGRLLVGTVADVSGWNVATVGYSKVAPKHRLATWARWLALTATDGARPWRGVTLGRHPWKNGNPAHALVLPPRDAPPADRARHAVAHLDRLVDLYDRGMCSPAPLYCKASAKSAEEARKGNGPRRYVDKEWETGRFAPFEREDLDPYHLLVLGRQVPTDELFVEPCPPDEAWGDEQSRFVAWARRLWEPILDTEQSRTR